MGKEPSVVGPSFEENLDTLKKSGSLTDAAAKEMLTNKAYFDSRRARILKEFQGQWVAALGGKLYVDNALEPLERQLEALPGRGDNAYAEQILAL